MSLSVNQLSNNSSKLIRSLHQKKYRIKHQLFIAEGVKIVSELLAQNNFKIHQIYASSNWIEKHSEQHLKLKGNITKVDNKELKKLSNLKTPNEVLAVVKIPEFEKFSPSDQALNIVLEDIRDPGNLGTIIRIADWYGCKAIYCSPNSVDCYNSKVIQAAMGSLFRVKVFYEPLEELFGNNKQITSYGTFMDGTDLNNTEWKKPCFLVMGNEANGISEKTQTLIQEKVSIIGKGNTESLNLSVATGIFVHQIMSKKQI